MIIKNNKVFHKNKKIAVLIMEKTKNTINIRWIETKAKGNGTKIINKLFADKTTKTIIGDSTIEALGFWKKIGAKLIDTKRINGGEGSRFILQKTDFMLKQKVVKN